MTAKHVLIIGGGIVGLSAAYFLAKRGAMVSLFDQTNLEGSASTGNAGLVAVGHGPLPRPGLTGQTIKWMLDPTSPLYIQPRLDASLARWLWVFRRACSKSIHERNLKVLTEHGRPAGACFRALVEDENIDCEYRPTGQMDVYRTQQALRRGEQDARLMEGFGYHAEVIAGDALRASDPAFRDEVVGAVMYRDRAFANPNAFIAGLAEAARRHGATIHCERAVSELILEDGHCRGVMTLDGSSIDADCIMLAAGAWTTALARKIGVNVPMQPAKGYHIMLSAPEPLVQTACVLGEVFVAVNPMGGGVRLAGTLEFSGINHDIRRARVEKLIAGAAKYLRGIEQAEPGGTWCGLRPCTADGLPVIGYSPRVRNLFIATGHAMMGFALGPLAGKLASECILDGESSLDLSLMRPDRFD